MYEINSKTKDVLKRLEVLVLGLNKKMNIVSKNDEVIVWERHIIDSLQPLFLHGLSGAKKVLDMGSGYGFPVVPLSICLPDVQFVAVESRTKRTTVINYLKRELGVDNLTVINDRVEGVVSLEEYDYVTSRALGGIRDDVERARPLLKRGGSYIGYKTEDCMSEEFFGMRIQNFKYGQASSDKNYYIVSVTKE